MRALLSGQAPRPRLSAPAWCSTARRRLLSVTWPVRRFLASLAVTSEATSALVRGVRSLRRAAPSMTMDLSATGRGLLARHRALNRAHPFAAGFALCFANGCSADSLAQKAIERRERLDGYRMLAMGLFCGSFCGCSYHFIFNIAFARIFGLATCLPTALLKAGADAIVVFPFLYMPWFLLFDEVLHSGTVTGLLDRWCADIQGSVRQYVKIWPPAMLLAFTVVPMELRVTFIAGVSFVWLIILSVISH